LTLPQIVIPSPTVGSVITIRIAATLLAVAPQPYALAITGIFRKDSSLYPNAVPRIESVATSGSQALLIGQNLAVSSKDAATVTFQCLSPLGTTVRASAVGYSPTAKYLAVDLTTTQCKVQSLQGPDIVSRVKLRRTAVEKLA
jgi:hypothetical protein